LQQNRISDIASKVGRKKEFTERVLIPLRPGTLDRIGAVLEQDEERTEFVRKAVERECKRRERQGVIDPAKK
jgi:hypothetical protein